MQIKIIRVAYYFVLFVAAVFFGINLLYSFTRHTAMDSALIKSTAVVVLFTGVYITTADKKYLISSIPLRIILFFSSILGLIAFFISDPHR